jgi:hypothetical protein
MTHRARREEVHPLLASLVVKHLDLVTAASQAGVAIEPPEPVPNQVEIVLDEFGLS